MKIPPIPLWKRESIPFVHSKTRTSQFNGLGQLEPDGNLRVYSGATQT